MHKVITVTTDFGEQFAASQLEAVVASQGFEGRLIANHSVSPFALSEGSFELGVLARYAPTDSVHLVVVDPAVGSHRWGIVIQTKRGWLVGPNNGVLYPHAADEGILGVWKIDEAVFGPISNTFHGRDVFIKVAVFLAKGQKPEEFGCIVAQADDLVELDFAPGQVLHVDSYGNCKIFWPERLVVGSSLIITHKGKTITVPVVRIFDDVAAGEPLALLGSSNTLELAVNLRNGAEFFRLAVDEVPKIVVG